MRVPVYESRVRPAALSTPHVSPAPSGTAALGAGIERLGSAALQIVTQERNKADAFRADSADLELGKALNAASWGDDGFLHQQGENALDYSERMQDVQRQAADISRGLANDRQREMFQARARARIEQTRAGWEKHAGTQRGVLFGQVAEGQTQLALDEAATSFADHDAVQSALMKVLHDPDGGPGVLVRYLRDVKGLPQEQVEKVAQAFVRKGYAGALQRYLDAEDADGAKKFIERFGEAMGPEADKARKAIAAIDAKRDAGALADEIVAGARTGPEGHWVDDAKALGDLDARDMPAEKKTVVRQFLRQRLADAEAVKRAEIDQRWKGALGAYNRGGLRAVPAATMDWLNEHAPELERKLRDDAEVRWRRSKADKASASAEQREANAAAMRQFYEMSPQDRAGTDLEDWVAGKGVDEAGRLALQKAKNSAADSVQKGDAAREDEFRRDTLAQAAGVVKSKEDVATLGAEAIISFNEFRDQNKRLPNREEAQKIQDDLLMRVTKKRTILPNTTELRFQQRARQRQETLKSGKPAPASPGAPAPAQTTRDEIPPLARQQIEATLRANGVPVSDEEIRRLYDYTRGAN